MDAPKAIIADLDGTLTPSRTPLSPDVAELITGLLFTTPFAVMSGSGFTQLKTQVLNVLAVPSSARFYLFPYNAARCYALRNGFLEEAYDFSLSHKEREVIIETLEELENESPLFSGRAFGDRIDDREASVTFSALGKDAPREKKALWDPDHKKREGIREKLKRALPEFEISIGGTTSIDITRKGITKAYGVRWLAEELNTPPEEMLYIGDALFPGGNDETVIATNIKTKLVSSPEETREFLGVFTS